MSVSGSHNFSVTRNEIIQTALQLLGVYGLGRTISSEDINFCNIMLNTMVKAWQVQGYHIFALDEVMFFATQYTDKYTIDGSSARISRASDTVITKLTASAAASATTLTVSSTTGMAASDVIGVVLDSGATSWTTISSVDSTTALTIASGISTAATSGRYVYTFTTRLDRPVRFNSLRRVTGLDLSSTSDRSDIEMEALSHHEFFSLPNRNSNGTTISYHYQPGVSSGDLYLWPRPSDTQTYFSGTVERFLDDFDSSENTSDFPVHWMECIIFQLAVRVAPAFNRTEKAAALLQLASTMLMNMETHDTEIEAVKFSPSIK